LKPSPNPKKVSSASSKARRFLPCGTRRSAHKKSGPPASSGASNPSDRADAFRMGTLPPTLAVFVTVARMPALGNNRKKSGNFWLGLGGAGGGGRISWRVAGQLADDKFLQEAGGGAGANGNQGVLKTHGRIAIGFRIVQIGEAACGEAAEHRGVIGLPVSIVAFTDKRRGNGIKKPGAPCAGPFIEVPWVLFQDRRQDGPADKRADGRVGVRRAVALGVALRALAIAAEGVGRLLNSGNGSRQAKVDGIDGGLPRELKFLFRVERSGGGVISDIKIGNDAEDALLLFILNLGFGYFDRRHRDFHCGGSRRYVQDDRRQRVILARFERSRSGLESEPRGCDRKLEGPGSDSGKEELAVGIGRRFLVDGRVFARELHVGSRDDGSGSIHNGSADRSCARRRQRLFGG